MKALLLDPALEGGEELRIVSGYASPAMLESHLRLLQDAGRPVRIHLVIGMSQGKLTEQDKGSYLAIMATEWGGSRVQSVSVVSAGPSVHSKVYVWSGPSGYRKAFAGSANYSVSAMVEEKTMEACAEVDWLRASDYFARCERNSKPVVMVEATVGDHQVEAGVLATLADGAPDESFILRGEFVDIPLLVPDGEEMATPARSGVNWGQREGREPNQAYLGLPSGIRDFFPPVGIRFMVYTRRFGGFVGVRAQADGKALHSSTNNSQLGKILRQALGVAEGAYVNTEDVKRSRMETVRCYRMVSGDFFLDI